MIIEKLPTRRYFITVFVIVLSLFVAFSLVIYKNFSDAQRLNQWTIYTYETARLSRKLLFDLVDMETGVRGYLITGNKKFLVPYDQSLRSINVQVKYLWEYTKSDPTMQDNIDNWLREIEKFNNLLDSQIRDISHGGKRGISPAVMEQQRKQMDRLRRSLETYIQQRLSLLNSQLKAADQSHQNFKYVLLIGATLAIGSTLLATVIILTLLSRSKRAEEESREIEQRFVAIMSGINDGVFDLNLVNDEIYYSSSYKSMLGYTDEEFPNVPNATWDMIHPEDLSQVREVFRAYLAGEQELYTNIYRMLHKQGQWIWVMSRGIGIRDKSGKIVRLIGTHTDITEQKKREEELASLNNEMEAFTYITSHDLRSPLVNLKGFAKEMDHAVTRVLPVLEAHMEQFSVEEQKVLHESIQVDIQESLRFIEQSVAKMDR